MADYVQTAASVLASAQAIRLQPNPAWIANASGLAVPNLFLAGVDIEAGQPVYQGTDGLIYLADANGADPLYKMVALAENRARAGQPISLVSEDPSFTPGLASMAIGDVIVLSGNVGKLCPHTDIASGMFVSVGGVAWSTTKMALKIIRADAVRA
jgi:hypothetical protein